MFDLFRRRDTWIRYVLMGLLGLVAISMVVTLIPGFGSGGVGGPGDELLAEIGGKRITVREAANRVEQTIRSMNVPRASAYLVASTVVDGFIAQTATQYYAEKMGFRVSDEELAEAIRLILPQAFPGGVFVGKEAYAGLLAQRGLSIADFESRVRAQLLSARIGDMIGQSTIVTPAEIETEFRRKNDQVRVEYVALRRAGALKQVSVSDAEIQQEFEKSKEALKLPERRAANLFVIDEGRTASGLSISEGDLRRAYAEQMDRFRTPERLKIRHILLKTTDKPEAEVKKLEAKAADLLKQLRAGADFAALAKANSEDPGSAAQGGDLGYVTRGQTVKNFEEAAWSLKPGQLSNVVKTEYGFHILQLMEREEARVRPFEEVRGELVAETQRQVVFDRMQKNADELRAALAKDASNPEQTAARFGALMVRVSGVGPQDAEFPIIGSNAELSAEIAALAAGQITSVMQAGANRLALAQVTAVEPARLPTLAEAADRLKRQIAERKAEDLLRQRANELRARAIKGEDLKKLAAEFKGEYKMPAAFNRSGAAEGLGSGEMLSEVFGKSAGYVPNPIGLSGDLFVARLVESIPAKIENLAAERDAIVQRIRQQRERERADLFQEGLVEKLTKEGKLKIRQDNLQRLLNSFRAA
jgi:peptidyl-prolyl cis-trans isomerase D